jgi:ABC-type phosphate transport system substrate-binding protein
MQTRLPWIAVPALAALLSAPRPVVAAPCSDQPNPIYISGSSAVQPFIQRMSPVLSAGASPVTLIYKNAGSCTGVNAIVADTTPGGACASGACITGTATYYTGTDGMTANTCDLDPNGTHLDVGVSDVFAQTCLGMAAPAGNKDFIGPAQAMCFAIPKASSQVALLAEEGYMVFGFPDDQGGVMPWLNNMFKFVRDQFSGTQGILSAAIGVPKERIQGTSESGSGGVLTGLTSSTSPEASIGMLAVAFYDAHRDTLTQLAFRAYKQYFAYWADSAPTSFDKRNVRDGHYVPFGYVHMIVKSDNTGAISNPNAKKFVDWVLGNTGTGGTPADFDITQIAIAAHVIPLCAMHVQRSAEGADLSLYSDPTPCDCYFEAQATGTAPSTCVQCSGSQPCATGMCRHGYCEPR